MEPARQKLRCDGIVHLSHGRAYQDDSLALHNPPVEIPFSLMESLFCFHVAQGFLQFSLKGADQAYVRGGEAWHP
ncbi:hypothetical protein DAMNIGENAA_14400 [Desulforhabdus amnigena]|uniref:Uncharacterized protein n=1 Tax=Desulforhabdus amnigena TaxID=40218 RepID=A0A9W6FRY0_9BACT|nr:hypothetical protein DAMNIGENAA_14400 [Desulforhabdus amnigena]